MVSIKDVQRLMAPLRRRIQLLADRAILTLVNDALQRQNLQLKVLAGETHDDVERFQNYGHTSVPPAGAEAIVLGVGGNRSGMVAVVVDHKGSRPHDLEPGDSMLYHLEGHNIRLTKDGTAIITVKQAILEASEQLTIISPSTTCQGDFHATGTISSDTDVTAGSISLKTHDHERGAGAPV